MSQNLDPQETLNNLSQLIQEGKITRNQILSLFPNDTQEAQVEKNEVHKSSNKITLQIILYYIGALIVLTGIVVLISQYWHDMSQVFKMVMTGTFAVSAYSLGYYFYVKEKREDFGHAFFTISAALFPLAIGTTLDGIGIHATHVGGAVINSAVLTIIFLGSYISLRAPIFLPFSVAAATALYFTGVHYFVKDIGKPPHFAEFEALTLGISYLLIAYYLKGSIRLVMNLMYFFGSVFILSAAMSLAGFSPRNDILWELAYPFILSLMFAISIKIQSKTILIVTTIFTFGEILKLTAQYFAQSIGWPISLIFAGLVIMGIGYISFEINRKYIKSPTTL